MPPSNGARAVSLVSRSLIILSPSRLVVRQERTDSLQMSPRPAPAGGLAPPCRGGAHTIRALTEHRASAWSSPQRGWGSLVALTVCGWLDSPIALSPTPISRLHTAGYALSSKGTWSGVYTPWYEPRRLERGAVGAAEAPPAFSETGNRATSARPSPGPERHPLDTSDRRTLAGPARALRSLVRLRRIATRFYRWRRAGVFYHLLDGRQRD